MLDANVQDVDKKNQTNKQTNPNKQREQNETKAGGQTANQTIQFILKMRNIKCEKSNAS